MDIIVNVSHQRLRIANDLKTLVAGTQRFIRFVFKLPNEWSNLKVFAQFTQDGNGYNIYLDENNAVYLPSQIRSGTCTLMLYGTAPSNVPIDDETVYIRATTNILSFTIQPNMLVEGVESTDINPTLYDQLVAQFEELSHQIVDMDDEQVQELIRTQITSIITDYIASDEFVQRTIAIVDNSIGTAKLVDGAITTAKINDSAVTTAKISNGAVTTDKIQDDAVTTDKINDGAITSDKVDSTIGLYLTSASTAMQPSVYDTNHVAEDIFDYADTKSATAITSAVSSIRNLQEFTVSNASGVSTTYTGLDSTLTNIVNNGRTYTDTKVNGTTIIVDTLPASGNENINYILAANGEYKYYKYIDGEWVMIAGGSAEILAIPLEGDHIIMLRHGEPTDEVSEDDVTNGLVYLDIDTMDYYIADETTDEETEQTVYYWSEEGNLVENPSENKDYYYDNNGTYIHFRYSEDTFHQVGSPSTLIVTELPLTGDSDVDYILNKDGEYQYYKYIDNEWQMISGGSAEIINEDYIISKFISETPIISEWNPLDHIGEHYILTNNLQHWFVEDNGSNDEHDYQWASEMLVAVPSTSKDYFVQFGITSDYLHFRYADDNKFHLVGSVTYSKDEIDNIIQGLNTTLGGEISDLGSDVSELKSQMNNISNMVKDVTISQDKKTLTVTYMNDATSTIELDTGTDIDTTRYNIDDDHKLHFYDSQGNELDGLTVEITGAGGGGSAVSGSVTIGRISASNLQTIFGSECEIEYTVTAVDASGEDVGAGTGTLYVNNVAVLSGFTVNTSTDGAFNSINVGDYLSVGNNTIKISVNVDTGGESNTTTTKTWSVNAINMYLSWDYTDSQVNTSAVTDYYTPFGALSKTIYTFIDVEPVGFNPKIVDALPDTEAEDFDVDDVIGVNYFVRSGSNYTHYIYSEEDSEFVSGVGRMLDVNTTTRSGVVQTLSIPMQTHGSHAIVRFMTGDVNGEIISTATQVHDMVFAVAGEEDPIIATSFNTDTMNQYNTVQIPIVVYDPNRTTTTVILAENGDVVSTWTGVDRTLHYWNYSPTTSGTKTLTIRCGSTTKTIIIKVTPLDITEEEISGYDFRFKASEMATNSAVQDWSSTYRPNGQNETKEVKFTFSDNFDWINGGLHTEYDEDNHIRQFFCVRAGTYVTINYDLFGKEYDPKQYGKNFKFIFKAVNCRTYDANVLTCMDTAASNNGVGLIMTANEATLTTANNSLKTYYYKDSYIEFETNIHPNTEYPYLQFWMDGSHDVTKLYDSSDDIQQVTPVGITIGSPNCDVYIYMIKAYPIYLTNSNELSNFIMDAPNAYEMVARYNRNNILNANGEVDYQLLTSANPDLHVIAMDINRMTTGKKDNVVAYSVRHIYNRGGLGQCFTINNACITVQGTSSVGYLESAGNVDINFKYNKTFTSDNVSYTTGEIVFDDGTTSTSGYSLSANSIPVDYLNVKVNVASSENANNACIADWYNTYQPWTSPARAKNSKARDTMEFVPGVIFIRDRSGGLFYTEQQDPQTGAVTKIPDTQNYHLYGICDIGNSKKNTKVFHDTKNPIACCVEVSNNTSLPCLMSSKDYSWNAKDEATVMELDPESGEMKEQKVFEFRYVDEDNSNTVSLAKNAWDRFVEFMVDNNPNLATNEPLSEPVTFGTYTFKGSGKYNTSSYESDEYNVIYLYGYGTPSDWGYAATDYVSDTTEGADCYYYINYSNDKIYSSDGTSWTEGTTLTWTRDQNNVLGGTSIGTYAKTYTTDSAEYRIAYMLNHCEEYMVIDPVVYHFIFIESFLMTDNVAKNTFWSSDDLVHWELSKNYDDDTSLGNDK